MTARGGIPSSPVELPALVNPNSQSTQKNSAPATSRADSSSQLILPDRRNFSPVAGAAAYDEGLGAQGMATHAEARELAVPGIQGLSSGSRVSTVRLVSVRLISPVRSGTRVEGLNGQQTTFAVNRAMALDVGDDLLPKLSSTLSLRYFSSPIPRALPMMVSELLS